MDGGRVEEMEGGRWATGSRGRGRGAWTEVRGRGRGDGRGDRRCCP